MKHIAFSKIGKSVKFASALSPIGGDNEAPAMLRLLANNNPDKTFYLVGRSDFNKLNEEQRIKLFPYGNVVDCYVKGMAVEDQIINFFKLKNFQPDVHICMVGQVGTVTIPGKIKQVGDPSLIASVIDMTKNYTTPIVAWMNETIGVVPTVEIINDPRYTLRQSRDIIPNPTVSLSQFDFTYTKSSIRSYADQTRDDHKIKCTYNEMEKIFLFGRNSPNTNRNRNTNFMIVLNEGSPSRYDMLNEWVLKNISDVEVYGKWEHESAVNDSRFKGSLNIETLQEKLADVKCTFIIPIEKGWVTSKYIEMIHAGVIPIFHPTYDEQNHLGFPDILKPKNPQDMIKLLDRISNDEEFYSKAIDSLQKKFCKPQYYNGSRLSEIVFSSIDKNYTLPDLSKFEKQEYESFSLDRFFD